MKFEYAGVSRPWTGPITEAGKAISSMNSLKHGLTARRAVLPGENQQEFDTLIASLLRQFQPAPALETELVHEIGACLWRLQRARAIEAASLHQNGAAIFESNNATAVGFDRLLRYTSAIERQLNRATAALSRLQSARRLEKPASESEPAPAPKPKSMAAGASRDFVSSNNAPPVFRHPSEPPVSPVRPPSSPNLEEAA